MSPLILLCVYVCVCVCVCMCVCVCVCVCGLMGLQPHRIFVALLFLILVFLDKTIK